MVDSGFVFRKSTAKDVIFFSCFMHIVPRVRCVFSSELLGGALVCALAREGLMGDALRHSVVKAMAKLQVLQTVKNVSIFLLILNAHLCEFFFLFFFLCRSTL